MNIFPPSGLYGMNESEKRQVTDCKYGSDYNDDLVFHTPFNIIKVISRQWKYDNDRLCAMKCRKLMSRQWDLKPEACELKLGALTTHWLNINETETLTSGPKVIKLFSYSTQLSMKFSLLINMKMPTIVGIVGIFIFIRRVNFMLSYV